MLRARLIAVAFVLGLLATLVANGQPNQVQPTHLALEVYFYPNEPPGYVVVPPARTLPVSEPLTTSAPTFFSSSALSSPPGGSWFSRFQRMPGWTPPRQNIEITMAVFEDGSFEGDIESAAGFRGFVKGRKTQLRRLVDVFQAIIQDESTNPSIALEMLRSKVNALGIDADPLAVQEVASEFSSLAERPKRGLTSAIEASMSGIRRDAQQSIAQFH